jgi:hypothetical protein
MTANATRSQSDLCDFDDQAGGLLEDADLPKTQRSPMGVISVVIRTIITMAE